MAHDPRLIKHEDTIEDLKPAIADWIKNLKRRATPCVVPGFGLYRAAPCRHEAGQIRRRSAPPGQLAMISNLLRLRGDSKQDCNRVSRLRPGDYRADLVAPEGSGSFP